MAYRLNRRDFLATALAGAVGFGLTAGGAQGVYKARDLIQQHDTWVEAERPNRDFLARHSGALDRLSLGASFAPEQWRRDPTSQQEAMQALTLAHQALGIKHIRLGLRWDRLERPDGSLSLVAYRPTLDYCLAQGMDVCLNLGPVRVFRWPEDHVPRSVLERLSNPPHNHDTLEPNSPLAHLGFEHVTRLSEALKATYGADLAHVSTIQIENEPFYPMGEHDWRMSPAYMRALAARVDASWPGRRLMVTSAGRLNLHSVRDLFRDMLRHDDTWRGRLVSGFDFHYLTSKRAGAPVLRYMDQITYALPFSGTTEGHLSDSRDIGFDIEVAEAQMEPYDQHLTSPGNSVKGLRYVILRCLDKVLDPHKPALIRAWGIEELTRKMLHNELTQEHRDMIALFQAINSKSDLPSPRAEAPSPR